MLLYQGVLGSLGKSFSEEKENSGLGVLWEAQGLREVVLDLLVSLLQTGNPKP